MFMLICCIIILILLYCRWNKTHMTSPKVIWMYWEQGEANLKDKYNKMCIEGWKRMNPDWNVVVLDKQSMLQLLPEVDDFFGWTTVQIRSDIIRTKLLLKYGGVWADASTLPLKPLTGNIENIDNGSNLFLYKLIDDKFHRPLSSWFIIAYIKNHYFLKELDKEFTKRLYECKRKHTKIEYFLWYDAMRDLSLKDKKIKDVIDKQTIYNTKSKIHNKGIHLDLDISNYNNLPLMFKRNRYISNEKYDKYLNSII